MINIVFVCVENSCRSQMAEACGKMLNPEGFTFYSSGSKASGVVNPKGIASMAEMGYDMSTHVSKPIPELPNLEFDVAITMGCGDNCGILKSKERFDWKIPDPKHMEPAEFGEIRDGIAKRVKDLVATLKA